MRNVFNNLDWSVLYELILSVIPALFCITVHEFCHGITALALGDDTAKNAGRLSLNPIKHMDVSGLLMMVVFHFGWAKPVPVNMNKFKRPKLGMALTALAGPVSNLLISCICLFIYGFLAERFLNRPILAAVLDTLIDTAYMSCGMAVFNLIPIPPLDGSKILFSLLPPKAYVFLMRYEKYGFFLLLGLSALGIFTGFLSTAVNSIIAFMFPVVLAGYYLFGLL